MRKIPRIMRIVTASLLCLTLATSCIISSTFAKYMTTGTSDPARAGVAMWGMNLNSGSDLNSSYASVDGNTYYVQSTGGNVVAPGTNGKLTWISIEGTPEVSYAIDFSGRIEFGDGYAHIIDEIGREIEYFPIALYLYRYDYTDGQGTSNLLAKHCIVRLTPDAPKQMIPASSGDEAVVTALAEQGITETTSSLDTKYRMSMFETNNSKYYKRWAYLFDPDSETAGMQTRLNGNNAGYSLNRAFDQTSTPGNINSVYAIEWDWAYDGLVGPAYVSANNNKKTRDDGTVYTYQTAALDTQLGEAMLKNPEDFQITITMSVSIAQIN